MSKPTVVAAVSGGVDSVVMLDVLCGQAEYDVVVAHVNHGIRVDAGDDEALVRQLAVARGLRFEVVQLGLGSSCSEECARRHRQNWLESVCLRHQAVAIATAHHQDDMIETALINLRRGTGWRGLCSLRATARRLRPLLGWSKAEVIAYAIDRRLEWREDSTNQDLRFERNYLRHGTVGRLAPAERQRFIGLIDDQLRLRRLIEVETADLLADLSDESGLDRHALIMAGDSVAGQLLSAYLGRSLERGQLDRLIHFVKTARPGKRFSLSSRDYVVAKPTHIVVCTSED